MYIYIYIYPTRPLADRSFSGRFLSTALFHSNPLNPDPQPHREGFTPPYILPRGSGPAWCECGGGPGFGPRSVQGVFYFRSTFS